ncbi:MAG: S46 family peptidase, partial [Saprospiraceae bacterium]
MFKLNHFFAICFLTISQCLFAGEGMWLPIFLKSLNEKEMKSMGMKISADDIYNINKGSLKDAIVQFGGGCTSEIISNEGLMLTNHHCGFGYIQALSSVDKNYIRDGFWARNKAEEHACSGLTATLIVRMEDVTSKILEGVDLKMSELQRRNKVDENIEKLKLVLPKMADQDVLIRAFYNGNQYFAFVTETYNDIRLVGTPPESIGKFGADTDNWVWPRHTGDFSLFRIYANKANRPAAYSKDNVPYKPKHFLPISLSGIKEGDFTMVFGFPGRTTEYLIYEAARQQVDVLNPVRISLRDKALKIMDKYMRADEKTKIQYASKYAGIANAWKKWIGENLGMRVTNGLDKKLQDDAVFQKRVEQNPKFESYRKLIPDMEFLYKRLEPFTKAREYYAETFVRNVDVYDYYQLVKSLINTYEGRGETKFNSSKEDILKNVDAYFKDFNTSIDQEIFTSLLEQFIKEMNPAFVFNSLKEDLNKHKADYKAFTMALYSSSRLTNKDSLAILMA